MNRARNHIAGDLTRKEKRDAVTRLRHLAAQFHLAPLDNSVDLLAGKVTLVYAFHPVAFLLQVEMVVAGAGEVFNCEIPMPADIHARGRKLAGLWIARRAEDIVNAFRDHVLIARLHLAGRDADAGSALDITVADRDTRGLARKILCHFLA